MFNFKSIISIYLFTILFSCSDYKTDSGNINSENNDIVIGKTITIGSLEIAGNNFPKKMSLEEAEKACNGLGDGWHLPTEEELNFININKAAIENLTGGDYWSSSDIVNDHGTAQHINDRDDGDKHGPHKNKKCYVRAIRKI